MKSGPQHKLSDSGRKRNKKVVNAKLNKSWIYIGDEYDRWMEIKTALRLETNSEVAKILLDRYAVTAACSESLPIRTVCATPRGAAYVSTPAQCATPFGAAYVSIPAHSAWKIFNAHLSDVSGMSSEHEQVESLTINNSEKNFIGDWNEDDDSASDYQPSLDATLRQDHNIRIVLNSDDEDMDVDIEIGDSIADEPAVELGPNISRIETDNDLTALLEDRTFLVFLDQILVLANLKIENCAVVGCHEEVVISTEVISSALYLKWTCKNNHLVNKWCSQPVLNRRLHSEDLLFSSALLIMLISGCSFQKISLFARFLKLAIPLSVSYLKMQRTYLAPKLDEIWEKEQNQVFLEFKDKELVLLGREFPNIKHSFDIWHGAKNLGKKVIKVGLAGQEKEKKCLLEWTRDIVNHFWYSADVSKSIQEFMGVWCGMIHHVVNEHEWSISYTDDGTYSCKQGPLCEVKEKGWLKAGSPAHDAAIGIVMDKRFIKKNPYFLNCSTAKLENFQNLILKNASKRHSFNPVSYRARNLLAALDNNAHSHRQMMVNKDGSTRYQRYYSKTGIQWSVYAKREDKDYYHVPTIIKNNSRKPITRSCWDEQKSAARCQ
ncbi:unnamed protein product [Mytilus coruscus]|uniref:Uncharacterized protein n=1 Tax=Mytilus coruscus TaxID=42192 RepID=A0A6J8ELZ1_MYTCO|nr:unnamed protein product [Mytilus coruscus]